MQKGTEKSAIVIGGGVAGMSAACTLAEAGLRVQLVERRSYLGGRASSYLHPGVNEVIDNCQHVLFGCCTNLIGFYERIGVERHIHWTRNMTMIEPGGRRIAARSILAPGSAPWPAEASHREGLHARRQDVSRKSLLRPSSGSIQRAAPAERWATGCVATARRRAPSIVSGGSSSPALSTPTSTSSRCRTPPRSFASFFSTPRRPARWA